MRKVTWTGAVMLALAAAVVALARPAPAPAAEGARVLMVDNEPDLTNWHFEPAEVTVPAGATVVWFNKGKQEHTVTADDKSFDSGMKKSGASWQKTFTAAGRYTYYCAPHPWMKGSVRVLGARAAAAEAPSAAATTTTAAPPTTAPAPVASPAAAPTSTTFPPSLAAQRPDTPAAPEATAPPAAPPPAPPAADDVAAPAGHSRDSGGNLAGTTALVVLPTLAALGIGGQLRRRSGSKPAEV